MNEKPKYPVIFTFHNDAIDKKIVEYQAKVIEKLTQGRIAFRPMYSNLSFDVMDHGEVMNKAVYHLLYRSKEYWDCILILDIDCIPLSYQALETTFNLAYQGNLVGNIQRSNHLENNQHTYVAPSYMCFTRDYYEDIGTPSLNNTWKYDVGECLTVNAEKLNKPTIKFMPIHVEYTPEGEGAKYYRLADGMPNYGIGTTFGYNGVPMSYHLFSSAQGTYKQWFFNKCDSIINLPN